MFEILLLFLFIWSIFSMLVLAVSKIPVLCSLAVKETQREKYSKKEGASFRQLKKKLRIILKKGINEKGLLKFKGPKRIKFVSWKREENVNDPEIDFSDDYWEKIRKG